MHKFFHQFFNFLPGFLDCTYFGLRLIFLWNSSHRKHIHTNCLRKRRRPECNQTTTKQIGLNLKTANFIVFKTSLVFIDDI